MHQYPLQNFNSIFGGLFGKKKPEEKKEVAKPEKKTETTEAAEPTKYHKKSIEAAQ